MYPVGRACPRLPAGSRNAGGTAQEAVVSKERRRACGSRTNSRASTVVPRLPPPGAGRLQPYPLVAGAAPHAWSDGEDVLSDSNPESVTDSCSDAAMEAKTAPMRLWEDMRCSTPPRGGAQRLPLVRETEWNVCSIPSRARIPGVDPLPDEKGFFLMNPAPDQLLIRTLRK